MLFGDRFGNPRVPEKSEKSEKFEKKVCGKGKPLSEVWEHGSLLRGGEERERGKGGEGIQGLMSFQARGGRSWGKRIVLVEGDRDILKDDWRKRGTLLK